MSGEREDVSDGTNGEFNDSCEPVSCPNPKCNQEFMDLDEDFWEHGNTDVDCHRCKHPAECVSSMQDEKRPSKIFYVYKCVPCRIKFTRKIPAMKRHCPSCKTKYRMFWHLLLKLPRHVKRPPRKVPLQSAQELFPFPEQGSF